MVKVSVIIPALNEASRIAKTIRHVQQAGPHEVIVVDGGSRDQTADIARQSGCRVLHTQPGRAIQQNHGADVSTGDVLFFVHADCWPVPDALSQIERAISNPCIVGGAFRQRIEAEGIIYRWLEQGNAMRIRFLQMAYGDQGIFLHRSTFEHLGKFPEVRLMEDLLLMRKLRRLGRVALLSGPLHTSARRWQRYGVIRQTARNWLLLAAEQLGVAPSRMATFYAIHDAGCETPDAGCRLRE